MSPIAARPLSCSEQERKELQQIKETVWGRLRQQQAVSELIWEAGHGMYQADERGLWPGDLEACAGAPRRPKREQWASQVFKMSDRQARKYFRVGERLTRKEIEGTGLCLDRMEQLALAPLEVRDVLRALG